MDVDGTLTDGKIYMGQSGEIMKAFNIKDGLGIRAILIPRGVKPIIITGRYSDIVLCRCKELGITDVYQDISDKIALLKSIISDFSSVAYIGDDINDLECMSLITNSGGIVACPSDSPQEVRNNSTYVCSNKGGEGCVREFIEWCFKDAR